MLKIILDFVLIRPLKVREEKHGVTFSENAGVKKAEVIEVGEGWRTSDGTLVPLSVKRGDEIYYVPGKALDVTIDGERLHIINHNSIVGIIGEEKSS